MSPTSAVISPSVTPINKIANTGEISCPLCGCARLEPGFVSIEKGFEVQSCPSCGLGVTTPALPSSEIGRYYPETYYGRENVRFNSFFEILVRLFRRRRAKVIARRSRPGPVLDVGCGRGLTLFYLKSLGFEAHGQEFSETAAWHARNALGLAVETGDFLKSPHQKGVYNAVVFWHSLEHLPRPAEALVRAHELLRPGGLLVVAVPNRDSLQSRLFGRHWFHLDVPRHYFHFNRDNLISALEKLSFRVVQEDHFSFEQNPYGWLQSFYNSLGFDNNFLYTILKNRSARSIQVRRHPLQALLTLLLLAPLTLLSLFLTVLEAALSRGGSVELYAVKE